MTKKFDIAIVGASFSGMSFALYLSKLITSLKICIIDKNDLLGQDRKADGRNFAISTKSAVNFCEPDYFAAGCVGEPWNVFSSLIIVFFGLYGL